MSVIDASKIQGFRIPPPCERSIKVLLAPDITEEVKDVSVTQGIIAPHSRNDLHTHEGFELLYIVSGFGRAVLGDETTEIRHDCLIVAPPGVPHQQINDSDDTMKMLAIWTPAVLAKDVIGRAVEANK